MCFRFFSGEHNGIDDIDVTRLALGDYTDTEETILLRRRQRHDSGSQHALRNSNVTTECNKNFPKKSQHVASSTGLTDYQHGLHHPYGDHVSDHEVDDDTGFPSNLYDIQERRESIMSIEACQDIANNDIENAEKNQESDEGEDIKRDSTEKKKNTHDVTVPEYRKAPLSSDLRVSSWLKEIQDPTEGSPPKFEIILPEIL